MSNIIISAILFSMLALAIGIPGGIIFYIKKRRKKKKWRFLKDLAHKLGGHTEGEKHFIFHKGHTLELIYKKHPEAPVVCIPSGFSGDFYITKNTSGNPDSIDFPIMLFMIDAIMGKKIKTGDREFDGKFDVIGSVKIRPFIETYFSDEQKKNAVEEIFKYGAYEIQFKDQTICATPFKDINPEFIKAVLEPLLVLTNDIPVVPEETLKLSPEAKLRLSIGSFPFILIIIGFISYIGGYWKYYLLSPEVFHQIVLRYIYVVMGLYFIFHIMIMLKPFSPGEWGIGSIFTKKGGAHSKYVPLKSNKQSSRSISFRKFFFVFRIVFAAILIYVSFTYAGRNLARLLNGMLDKGEQTEHTVEDIYKFQNKKNLSYIRFPSWRNPGTKEQLHIGSSEYKAIVPGKTKMIITTKPGAFGFEWIVSKKIEQKKQEEF